MIALRSLLLPSLARVSLLNHYSSFVVFDLSLQLEEGEDFLDVLKKETVVLGDANMRKLKQGEVLQLERKGYFRCDGPSKPLVLFAIPNGRAASSFLEKSSHSHSHSLQGNC